MQCRPTPQNRKKKETPITPGAVQDPAQSQNNNNFIACGSSAAWPTGPWPRRVDGEVGAVRASASLSSSASTRARLGTAMDARFRPAVDLGRSAAAAAAAAAAATIPWSKMRSSRTTEDSRRTDLDCRLPGCFSGAETAAAAAAALVGDVLVNSYGSSLPSRGSAPRSSRVVGTSDLLRSASPALLQSRGMMEERFRRCMTTLLGSPSASAPVFPGKRAFGLAPRVGMLPPQLRAAAYNVGHPDRRLPLAAGLVRLLVRPDVLALPSDGVEELLGRPAHLVPQVGLGVADGRARPAASPRRLAQQRDVGGGGVSPRVPSSCPPADAGGSGEHGERRCTSGTAGSNSAPGRRRWVRLRTAGAGMTMMARSIDLVVGCSFVDRSLRTSILASVDLVVGCSFVGRSLRTSILASALISPLLPALETFLGDVTSSLVLLTESGFRVCVEEAKRSLASLRIAVISFSDFKFWRVPRNRRPVRARFRFRGFGCWPCQLGRLHILPTAYFLLAPSFAATGATMGRSSKGRGFEAASFCGRGISGFSINFGSVERTGCCALVVTADVLGGGASLTLLWRWLAGRLDLDSIVDKPAILEGAQDRTNRLIPWLRSKVP